MFALDGDQVGAPIAGAQFAMTSGEEVIARTTSDSSGRYAFNGLETGKFRLTISAPGFSNLTPQVHLDRDRQVDFAMRRQ